MHSSIVSLLLCYIKQLDLTPIQENMTIIRIILSILLLIALSCNNSDDFDKYINQVNSEIESVEDSIVNFLAQDKRGITDSIKVYIDLLESQISNSIKNNYTVSKELKNLLKRRCITDNIIDFKLKEIESGNVFGNSFLELQFRELHLLALNNLKESYQYPYRFSELYIAAISRSTKLEVGDELGFRVVLVPKRGEDIIKTILVGDSTDIVTNPNDSLKFKLNKNEHGVYFFNEMQLIEKTDSKFIKIRYDTPFGNQLSFSKVSYIVE